jgi:hypothetical protein
MVNSSTGMALKLSQLDAKLRARIEKQIAAEDAARAVGAGAAQSAQPDRRGQSQDCRVESPAPRVGYRITLIQCRRRCLDAHDSLAFSVKPLVDEITRFLGYSNDNDPALQWEYAQLQTKGSEGTAVKIEAI